MSTVTASSSPPAAGAGHLARPSAWPQVAALSMRAIRGTFRQGPLLLPPLLFPLVFVAINASSFERSLPLLQGIYPGLDSFLTFALSATVVQGVLFGSVQGATDLATDIEGGFFERLIAAPVHRWSILVGRLAGAAVTGAIQAAAFTVLLWAFGARIEAGPLGALVIVATGALVATAFGALLCAMSIRTGSAEAVQSTFPLVFVLLFASSAFFPRQTMTGWFRRLADLNPISHLVEGMRELDINGWSVASAGKALGIPVAIGVVGIVLSLLALRRRLEAR